MAYLLGLTGAAGVGKDTVADYLVRTHGFKRYAFADAVRDIALAIDPIVYFSPAHNIPVHLSTAVTDLGWDMLKRKLPEVRRLLQRIGTEAGRMVLGTEVWVNIIAEKLHADGYPDAVITDVRFPNEVSYVREIGGAVVNIARPDNPHAIAATHVTERLQVQPDFTVVNDGSLESLYVNVDRVLGKSHV